MIAKKNSLRKKATNKQGFRRKVLLWLALGFSIGMFVCTPFALLLGDGALGTAEQILIAALVGAFASVCAFIDKTNAFPVWQRALLGVLNFIIVYAAMFYCGWIGSGKLSGFYYGICFLAMMLAIYLSQNVYFERIAKEQHKGIARKKAA